MAIEIPDKISEGKEPLCGARSGGAGGNDWIVFILIPLLLILFLLLK